MLRRFLSFTLLGAIAASTACINAQTQQGHAAWVAEALKRMQTIKPGMTRTDLLKVFTTEGGLSTPMYRTFVSRDCPYFKVDVVFEPVAQQSREAEGRQSAVERPDDKIAKISRPYLAFSVSD